MTGRGTVNNQSSIVDGRVLKKLAIDSRGEKKKKRSIVRFGFKIGRSGGREGGVLDGGENRSEKRYR